MAQQQDTHKSSTTRNSQPANPQQDRTGSAPPHSGRDGKTEDRQDQRFDKDSISHPH